MDAHVKHAHSTKKTVYKYMCAKCGKGFDNKAHYQIHENHHNDMKHYSCGKCDYHCYSTSQLNLHVASCIDGISHECSICGKEFLQKQYLKNHFKNEHLNDNNKKSDRHCSAEAITHLNITTPHCVIPSIVTSGV